MNKPRPVPPDGNDASGATAQTREAQPSSAVTIDSQALLQGGSLAYIVHNGELYRLRVTKQGKLILSK